MRSVGELYGRYLRLLGFRTPPSGQEGLEEIVSRHLCRVPFENISKLLLFGREGLGRVITLGEFLYGIEYLDLGGTCYSSNPYLASLLQALGYDAVLLGADMDVPNLHTSVRVRTGPIEYHIDVGYAAPFREPMRLDRLPHEIVHGDHRYVLDRYPSGEGHELTVYRGLERVHGYVVHGPRRPFEAFTQTILESFLPGKTFMSCLRITRFFEEHTVELRNRTLICYRGSESSRTTLNGLAELQSAVADQFSMPRCPVEEAVRILERVTGTPFFEGER